MRLILISAALLINAMPVIAKDRQPLTKTTPPKALATFAGGCFWCMEPPFAPLNGVIAVTSGYTGGKEPTPTYAQVAAGQTGHAEAVQVVYDPTKIQYADLLAVFWRNIDPFAVAAQFCDRGRQYRAAVFFHDAEQERLATAAKAQFAAQFKKPIVTEITKYKKFYPAEDYHQDYYQKNPAHYKSYRHGCGRDRRLKEVWGEH